MKRGGSSKMDYYSEPLHEKPVFQILLFLLLLATLIVSSISLYNTLQLKNSLIGETINADDFLQKLTAHPEAQQYQGVDPQNIIQINNNNLANLQQQIQGLDTSFVGDFLVQYPNELIIYDYQNDEVKGTISTQQLAQQQAQQQGQQLPQDFFQKLNAHPEMEGLQNQQPVGGQLDQQSLQSLQQQFPDVYANAEVGDFLLRYPTMIVVYDYQNDEVINTVEVQPPQQQGQQQP